MNKVEKLPEIMKIAGKVPESQEIPIDTNTLLFL
jgi:hypothetical protein